jgi:biotin transport system ATP-binding protein
MSNVITVVGITKKFRNLIETPSTQNYTTKNQHTQKMPSDGMFYALNNVSFSIEEGETVVIGGANGSGKSVLMSIIAKLSNPTSGSVTIKGRVGLVFQDSDTQILGETPEEDIAFGLKNIKVSKKNRQKIISDMINKTGLSERCGFPARFLSGGEKRRLAVAGILALDSPIIIFDEPYANLDYEGIQQVNALIALLQRENRTIIILTHELEKCLALADRFLVLYKGKLVFDGKPQEGLTKPLETWKIKNPLTHYTTCRDLVWL